MKSKLIARRTKSATRKSATVLVSKETLEDAIQAAHELATVYMEKDPNNTELDKVEEAASFLEGLLAKSPSDMQREGASTLEDYLDDAILPEVANKIKGYVDMISTMKQNQHKVTASGSDNFVAPQNSVEEGGEKVEVPRLAAAAPAPVPPPPAPVAPAPAPSGDMTAEQVLDVIPTEAILKIVEDLPKRDDFQQNPQLQDALIFLTEVLKTRPVEPVEPEVKNASSKKRATIEHRPGHKDSTGNSAPWCNVKDGKVLDSHATKEEAEKALRDHEYFKGASFLGGLSIAASENNGGWFVDENSRGMKVEEGSVPEIGQAHSETDDKTGIKRPATEDISKFAAELTPAKAVKLAEKISNDLKAMYLEAKVLTNVDASRPVREAVESIFRAYDLMGAAAKTLNKLVMAEEAEQEAVEVKEQNRAKKSAWFGLSVAAAE